MSCGYINKNLWLALTIEGFDRRLGSPWRPNLSPTKTVWPSGLWRWLQAPVRKGVGSNPTAVIVLSFRFGLPVGKPAEAPRTLSGSRARRFSRAWARWHRRKNMPTACPAMFLDTGGDHQLECLHTSLDCNTAASCCCVNDACKRSAALCIRRLPPKEGIMGSSPVSSTFATRGSQVSWWHRRPVNKIFSSGA